MGRWRPPAAAGSLYITAAGFAALQTELQGLWSRRSDVVRALAAAAAEGDRSENAEYIYRKKELAGIDRRIRYLQRRLPQLKVIREFREREQVYFGAWVSLLGTDGQTLRYRIVGPDEVDADSLYISLDSPLAQALMKHRAGDTVRLKLHGVSLVYTVTSVQYAQEAAQADDGDG